MIYGLYGSDSQQQFQSAQTTGTTSLPVAQQRVQESITALSSAQRQAEGNFTGAANVATSVTITPDLNAALARLQKLYEGVAQLAAAGNHLRTFPRDWVEQAVPEQVHGGWAFGSDVDSERLLPWNKWQIYDALARTLQPLAQEANSMLAESRELREAVVEFVQQSQIEHDSTLKTNEYALQDQQVVDELSRARQQLEEDRRARMSTADLAAAYAEEDRRIQDQLFQQQIEANQQIMQIQAAERMEELDRQRAALEAARLKPTVGTVSRQQAVAPPQDAVTTGAKLSIPLAAAAALAAWKFL